MKKINTKNILKKIFKSKTDSKVKKKVAKKKSIKSKKIPKIRIIDFLYFIIAIENI